MKYCIVITTCPNQKEAETLASKLISERLAACVQINQINSWYVWKNDICNEPELKLVIKTTSELYHQLEKFIKCNHSYEVPQIIQVPILGGSTEYLSWIDENTQ